MDETPEPPRVDPRESALQADQVRNEYVCAIMSGLLSRVMAQGQDDLLIKMAFQLADEMMKYRAKHSAV